MFKRACSLCGLGFKAEVEADVLNQVKNHRGSRKCRWLQEQKKKKVKE